MTHDSYFNPIDTAFREYVALLKSSDLMRFFKPGNVIIPANQKWVESLGFVTDKPQFSEADFPCLLLVPVQGVKYAFDSCAMGYELSIQWRYQLRDNDFDTLLDIHFAFLRFEEMAIEKLCGQGNLITEIRDKQDAVGLGAISERMTWSCTNTVTLVLPITYDHLRRGRSDIVQTAMYCGADAETVLPTKSSEITTLQYKFDDPQMDNKYTFTCPIGIRRIMISYPDYLPDPKSIIYTIQLLDDPDGQSYDMDYTDMFKKTYVDVTSQDETIRYKTFSWITHSATEGEMTFTVEL